MNPEEEKKIEEGIQNTGKVLSFILKESLKIYKKYGNKDDNLTFWKIVDLMIDLYKYLIDTNQKDRRLNIFESQGRVSNDLGQGGET